MPKKPTVLALQMDPVETIRIEGDSTFSLALEAQARGFTLYYYTPRQLTVKENRVMAYAHPVTFRREPRNFYTLGEPRWLDLEKDADIVLLRQDPPFNMEYITSTYLLERIQPKTLVLNNPTEVRNCPEKLFPFLFADFMPPTLLSQDKGQIEAFLHTHQEIVIKPLYGHGGAGICHIKKGDDNLPSLLEMTAKLYPGEPLVIQRYLPEVRQGDVRILMIDGEIAASFKRIPAAEEIRSNLARGGTAEPCRLSTKEEKACQTIGKELKRRGLFLAGLDMIGGYLTEINITSPTGLQMADHLYNTHLAALFWDRLTATENA